MEENRRTTMDQNWMGKVLTRTVKEASRQVSKTFLGIQ